MKNFNKKKKKRKKKNVWFTPRYNIPQNDQIAQSTKSVSNMKLLKNKSIKRNTEKRTDGLFLSSISLSLWWLCNQKQTSRLLKLFPNFHKHELDIKKFIDPVNLKFKFFHAAYSPLRLLPKTKLWQHVNLQLLRLLQKGLN